MSAGWLALREADRDLALALLFTPRHHRENLADRLNLALECEAAVRVASEPMLAAIRLQWWVEAIETGQDADVPLLGRLRRQIAAGEADAAALTGQIGLWQDRLATAPDDAGACWAGCFAALAPDHRQAAEAVAKAMFGGAKAPGNAMISGLASASTRWLWMLGRLAQHRGGDALEEDPAEDPLLVWRMLGWRYFG